MKKHSLLKVMGITLLLVLVLSYIIPGRGGEVSYLPFGDIVTNYIQSYYYFFDIAVFILAIGAFYGVLNKTDAYKKILDRVAKKVKPLRKKFLMVVIIAFALISSLTGITTQFLIFVPFVISIILLLGYDKLVAISSTVVAMLIGLIGGIFTTFRDTNSYGYAITTFEKFVGIDKYTNLFPQLLILIIGIVLLILFVSKHIKSVENKEVKYELNDEDILVTETKENNKNVKTWPLILVLSLLLVILALGLIPWNGLFEIKVFDDFHTWITELNIKEFGIFNNVISTIFVAFGQWGSLGNFMMTTVVILVTTLVIKLIYKVKFDDLIDGFVEGAKKMLPTTMLIMLAYCILVCAYNNGFIETIVKETSKNGDINFVLASLITMVGSVLHVDLYYTVAGVCTPIIGAVTNEAMLDVFALAFQSLYGIVNIIGPTSLLLIFALSYLDVPYTTWLKYIWRFILSIFIVVFAILLILTLI